MVSILRRSQVEARTGLARSTIYAGMTESTFPRAVKIGSRSVGWVEQEIDDWLHEQIAKSRNQARSE